MFSEFLRSLRVIFVTKLIPEEVVRRSRRVGVKIGAMLAIFSLAEYLKVPPPCQESGTYQDKQDNLEER